MGLTRAPTPLILACLLLSACAAGDKLDAAPEEASASMPGTPSGASGAARTMPRAAEITVQSNPPKSPQASGSLARGTGNFVGMPSRVRRIASVNPEGEITLNFLNADVRDVAKAILGDYLKLNYVIDSAVQGTISIQTNQPLSHNQVLPALQQALRFNGMALLSEDGLYKVVPGSDAPRRGGGIRIATDASPKPPGFGVEIVPLRYVGAQEMQRVLEPLTPKGAILEVDTARNLLILGGSEGELGAIRDDIEIFDVDWMAGMSFAIYPLKAVNAKTLMEDLNEVMGGRRSPIAGLVRFVPLERMNAILAVSPQAKYLDRVRSWITELDEATQGAEQRIYIYYIQNGQASSLASALNKLLGVSGASSSSPASPRPSNDQPDASTSATAPPASPLVSGGGMLQGAAAGQIGASADQAGGTQASPPADSSAPSATTGDSGTTA